MSITPPVDKQITFLYTNDLDKTTAFYENIMGFSLSQDQGMCKIFKVAENAYLGFCHDPETPIRMGKMIFTLVTDQVDEWFQYLQDQKDVAIEQMPAHDPQYHIYHGFIRDPNGYKIEIQKFLRELK